MIQVHRSFHDVNENSKEKWLNGKEKKKNCTREMNVILKNDKTREPLKI